MGGGSSPRLKPEYIIRFLTQDASFPNLQHDSRVAEGWRWVVGVNRWVVVASRAAACGRAELRALTFLEARGNGAFSAKMQTAGTLWGNCGVTVG